MIYLTKAITQVRHIFILMLCGLLLGACEKPLNEEEEDPSGEVVETPGHYEEGDTLGESGWSGEETEGNGEETDIVDSDEDTNHRNHTYTVTEFINTQLGQRAVKVEGYIVGSCTKTIKKAEWQPPFTHPQAILLSDKKGESNPDKVMSVSLKKKPMRAELNLVDHPENWGRKVYVYGVKTKYLGIPGMSEYIGGYGWAN